MPLTLHQYRIVITVSLQQYLWAAGLACNKRKRFINLKLNFVILALNKLNVYIFWWFLNWCEARGHLTVLTANYPPWPLSFPLPISLTSWGGYWRVDLCTSRRLVVTFPETEGSFRGLTGPVLPQPVPPGLGLQPELLLGKPGPTPYFWECRSTGAPGFPLHGPLTGQYGLFGGWQCGEPKNWGYLDAVSDKSGANIC